jgi:4-hydroxy-2-oxoglutarate aldolase
VADRSPLPVMIYNVPPFTAYDIPVEVVMDLAEHANIIGIKESSGDVEKVSRMVEGTRHIKRSATVTETFEAVTPRMLAAAASGPSGTNGAGGEFVQVGAMAGNEEGSPRLTKTRDMGHPDSSSGKPSSTAVTVVGKMKTRRKEVGFQVLIGAAQKLHPSLDAGAVGAILAFACPAPTACYEIYAAWKEGDADLARLKQERISTAAQRVGSELGISGLKHAMDFNGYYGGPARLPLLPLTADLKADVERLMEDIRN